MAANAKLTHAIQGKKVESARQRGEELDIDFEDGTTLSVVLSSADSSVTVRDKNDKEVYSG